MCDYFWQRMDGDQGDLADIVRAGGLTGPSSSAVDLPISAADWQLPSEQSSAFIPALTGGPGNDFGDPFANLGDPLLHELTGMEFFDGAEVAAAQAKLSMNSSGTGAGIGIGISGGGVIPQKVLLAGAEVKRPCNIFPRVAPISLGVPKPSPLSPRAIKPSPLATGAEIMKASSSSAACCSADPGCGVQIPSPRTPGTKRRKNQAKKVVCIPAPAAASNRPSGEVVPSDLWAWRKYGQKPIKGSPYPRGYYRCSSSKGCSARKQVERSRTDPSMLVITYTSEHNHPWPTQRNALAGSTRSQLSKNGSNFKSTNHSLKSPAAPKEEHKEMTSSAAPSVKEEDVSETDIANDDPVDDTELDQVFNEAGYKPMIPEATHADDFFADLVGLDPDPMSLIFSKGLVEAKPDHDQQKEDKTLDDPFNMFDWATDGPFIGEHKKGDL